MGTSFCLLSASWWFYLSVTSLSLVSFFVSVTFIFIVDRSLFRKNKTTMSGVFNFSWPTCNNKRRPRQTVGQRWHSCSRNVYRKRSHHQRLSWSFGKNLRKWIQSKLPLVWEFIFRILSFYIKQSPSLGERRDLKDLQVCPSAVSLLIALEEALLSSFHQDITMRVLDSCNTIVASSLEQTTWLRKNLQVRVAQPDAQSMKSGSVSNPLAPVGINSSNETSHLPTDDAADFDGKLL